MTTGSLNLSGRDLEDHIAIGAVIKDSTGKILSFFHDKWGFWTVPVGKNEVEEVAEEALKREMKEELGIDVVECKVVYESDFSYTHSQAQRLVHNVLFEVMLYREVVRNLEPHIHQQLAFREPRELAEKKHLSDMLMLYLDSLGIAHKDTIKGVKA